MTSTPPPPPPPPSSPKKTTPMPASRAAAGPSSIPAPAASSVPISNFSSPIGVWGPPGSGKTNLLLSIIWKLRGHIAGYHADYPSHLPSTSAEYRGAHEMFRLAADFGARDFAARTLGSNPFSMYFTREDTNRGRDGHFHLFSVLDVTGEFTLDIGDPEFVEGYWQHLRQTQGILFVVGASSRTEQWFEVMKTSYEAIVEKFVSHMKETLPGPHHRPCQQHIMICLTQADKIMKPDMANTFAVRSKVEEILGRTSLELLEKTFPHRVSIVATSAVGWTKDKGGHWQANAMGETILQRERQPYNAVYALFRLLDYIEAQNIQKHRWFPLRHYTIGQRRKNVALLLDWKEKKGLHYMP